MFRRMPTLYCYLRCGDLRSPGVTERRNGQLRLRDDDDDTAIVRHNLYGLSAVNNLHIVKHKMRCMHRTQ